MSLPARELLKLSRSYGRKAKYRNVPTTAGGIRFDSRAEGRRYGELKLLEKAGEISGLKVHERFPLSVCGTVVGDYEADFTYRTRTEQIVVEDVKSKATRTPLYRWKRKHMLAQYGIEILEVP